MNTLRRRAFLKLLAATGAHSAVARGFAAAPLATGNAPHTAARISNDYSMFLPGEREALAHPPPIASADHAQILLAHGSHALAVGQATDGWHLLAIADMNGILTAIF